MFWPCQTVTVRSDCVYLLCVVTMCTYCVYLLCVLTMCSYYVYLLCVLTVCTYYVWLLYVPEGEIEQLLELGFVVELGGVPNKSQQIWQIRHIYTANTAHIYTADTVNTVNTAHIYTANTVNTANRMTKGQMFTAGLEPLAVEFSDRSQLKYVDFRSTTQPTPTQTNTHKHAPAHTSTHQHAPTRTWSA